MNASHSEGGKRLVVWSLAALGMASVMTQLALMREMLCAFSGNELVLGVVLGNWFLLTGAGAWLGRRSDRLLQPLRVFALVQLGIALLPPLQVVLLRILRNVIFLPGAAIGLGGTFVASLVLLLPFCVLSGYLLALGCAILATGGDRAAAGTVYFADSLGSILGGAAFSFLLVRWLDHFALLCIPGAVNLVLAGSIAFRLGRVAILVLAVTLLAGLVALTGFGIVDLLSTARQFPGQAVLFCRASPYGKLVVTSAAGELTFFENGLPMVSTHSVQQIEETVDYALAQRLEARQVLLISGGISGTAREILKHGVEQVTYVELDPLLIEAGRRFLPDRLSDPRIKTVTTDGRRFIRETPQRYDVVIVDVPAPATAQLNRFFTTEFFAEVSRLVAPRGVLSFALGRYENYVSPELGKIVACAHRTLRLSFEHVLELPAGHIFFLASNGDLHTDVAERLERKGVVTRLVNRHYLDAMFTPDRFAQLGQAALGQAAVNQDFSPVLYYYHLRYWLSQFQAGLGWWPVLLLVFLGAYLLTLGAPALAIFASGFAASALEMVLLLGIQILCGSLYYQLGVVVTLFMAGLAVGAFWTVRFRPASPRRALMRLAFGIAVLAALLPIILPWLGHSAASSAAAFGVQAAIAALAFLLALLVGAEFPLASQGSGGSATAQAAGIYLADFLGACLGAWLASTWLLPVLGLSAVCLLAAALNLGGGLALRLAKS